MTGASQFRWTSAACSHVGLVRDVNEDCCFEATALGVWAVADGMGGHSRGDFASRMVVDGLAQVPPGGDLAARIADVRDRLQLVNRQLLAEAAMRDVRIIGSTVVVLLAEGADCACLWAGDSRLYLLRGSTLLLLTRDHSQVEALKQRGDLSAEAAAHHPAQHLITRAVGATEPLLLDQEAIAAEDGDMFVLCSDGLSNEVSADEMRSALVAGDCVQAAEALIDLALHHGGRDNISAVVVRVDDLSGSEKTAINPAL